MLQHRLAHDDDGEDALVQDLLQDGALSGLGGRGLVGGDEVDFCAQDPGSQVSQDQGRSRFLRGTSQGRWVVMRYLPLLPLAPRTMPSSTQPA